MFQTLKNAFVSFRDFLRRHWKATTALIIAGLVFGTVTGAVVLFPAVLSVLAATVLFGAAPFAFLAAMPVLAAAAVVGVVVGFSVLAGLTAFNLVTAVANWMDKKIVPTPNPEEVKTDVAKDAVDTQSNCQKILNKLCSRSSNNTEPASTTLEALATRSTDNSTARSIFSGQRSANNMSDMLESSSNLRPM